MRDGFEVFDGPGPFLEEIGPVFVRQEDGAPVFGLQLAERHANHRGTIQGGLLATLADFAVGRAIEADADDDRDRATVSLTVDVLKPANPGEWIEARARVERVGGTVAFADCTLTVDGSDVVRARVVFAAT